MIKITKEHLKEVDAVPGPRGKFIWIRLAIVLIAAFCGAVILVTMAVMLINKIMEQ